MGARVTGCTGMAATWCPIHGDCTCPWVKGDEPSDGFDPDAVRDLNSETCPLHSSASTHAEVPSVMAEATAGRWPAAGL